MFLDLVGSLRDLVGETCWSLMDPTEAFPPILIFTAPAMIFLFAVDLILATIEGTLMLPGLASRFIRWFRAWS